MVNEFFYWLRASRLETDRVAYWWANRMLTSPTPLREKLALFWHGHFATNEDKVRDYRKMQRQLDLFRRAGAGQFDVLLREVSKDPAMLAFLDAGINIKGSPNENFAREIMELFTMGVGHYEEVDIREAARAFTGWNFVGLEYAFNESEHDRGEKCFLGECGHFDGDDVIDRIVSRDATAEFIAVKLYRFSFAMPSPKPSPSGSARSSGNSISTLARISKRSSFRGISMHPSRSGRGSKDRSNLPCRRTRRWGSRRSPAFPISTA